MTDADVLTDSVQRQVRVDSLPLLPRLQKRTGASRFVKEKIDLDAVANFESSDSVVMFGRNLIYLYGDAQVWRGVMTVTWRSVTALSPRRAGPVCAA